MSLPTDLAQIFGSAYLGAVDPFGFGFTARLSPARAGAVFPDPTDVRSVARSAAAWLPNGVTANGDRHGQVVQCPEGLRFYSADKWRSRRFRAHFRGRAGRHGWPAGGPEAELRARARPARPRVGGQSAAGLRPVAIKGALRRPFFLARNPEGELFAKGRLDRIRRHRDGAAARCAVPGAARQRA